jgi:hypothetical protein
VPPTAILYSGSFRAQLGVTDTFSQRWTGGVSGFYQMSGGLDFSSQLTYPPNRGGGGDVLASYALSRRDALVSAVHADYTYVVTTTDKFLGLTYIESIRHNFTPRTTGTIGAGVAMIVRRLHRQDAISGAVSGAGEASIAHTAPFRDRSTFTTRAGVNVGEAYNPYLGTMDFLGSATLSAGWAKDPVTVTISAAAASSLPFRASDAARVASGAVTLGYALGRAATVQTGARAYTQLLPSPVAPSYPPQWAVFIALLLTAPPEKF